MTCHKIQSRLSAYLDGELAETKRSIIQNHLDTCSECQTALLKLQQVDAFLDDGVQLQSDPYLITRVKASVTVNRASLQLIRAIVKKSLFPATILAGLYIGILIGTQLNAFFDSQPIAVDDSTPSYSVIDPSAFESMPSGSITATYASFSSTK